MTSAILCLSFLIAGDPTTAGDSASDPNVITADATDADRSPVEPPSAFVPIVNYDGHPFDAASARRLSRPMIRLVQGDGTTVVTEPPSAGPSVPDYNVPDYPVPNDAGPTPPGDTYPTLDPPTGAQSAEIFGNPGLQSPPITGPGVMMAPNQPLWDPQAPQTAAGYDPFLGPPPGGNPYGNPYLGGQGGYSQPGLYGQPYRFGYIPSVAFEFLPDQGVDGAPGTFGVFGIDAMLKSAAPFADRSILNINPLFQYRNWDGPGGGIALPDDVFRFGAEIGVDVPRINGSPYTLRTLYTPSIASGFQRSAGELSVHHDGEALLIYEYSPELSVAYGVAYRDLVNDRVLPIGGIIWRFDPRWELQLMFPESRLSYFLGHGLFGGATWLYGRAEWHREAYEVVNGFTNSRDEVELQDYRLAVGLRKEYPGVSLFAEVGLVFDREVIFRSRVGNFSPDTGVMTRFGVAF